MNQHTGASSNSTLVTPEPETDSTGSPQATPAIPDDSMIASLEARIAAAMSTVSRTENASPLIGDTPRLLYRDRRDRLEQFADNQLRILAEVSQQVRGGDPPKAEALHHQLTRSFAQAKADSYAADWELAAYPLAVTIDEFLLDLKWPGQRWWEDHVLESTLFGTRIGSQRFFEMAGQLKSQRSHPMGATLLRIHHDCVAVGFRGLYSTANPALLAEPLGLPVNLSQWQAELHRAMVPWTQDSDASQEPDASDRHSIPGAAPLRYRAVTWILGGGCVVLLAINVLMWSGLGR